MRSVKIFMVGLMLGAATPGLHAQATGAAQTVRKSAEAASQAPAQPVKPVDKSTAKPAAQNTPKSAPAAGTQPKTAPPATAKSSAPAPVPAKQPAAATATKSTPQAAKPAAQGGATPQAAKPAVKSEGTAAKKRAKSAKKSATPKAAEKKAVAKKPSKDGSTLSAQSSAEPRIPRRDPFESLVGREQSGGGGIKNLPVGKAGLQVSTLRLDGVVRAPNGMIAVVSNPQSRTYFLREGDQLYDGRVEKIAMDGVSFHEIGKDAFGKPVERQVNKRIYASAGEQQ